MTERRSYRNYDFGDDLAHCGCVDDRLLLRRVREFLRARQDETHDAGPAAVDAHHRLDDFGEAVDSALFYPLAFCGVGLIPNDRLPQIMLGSP